MQIFHGFGKFILGAAAVISTALPLSGASAEEIHAAVAANFTAAMKEIVANYEAKSGNKVLVSYGSTGKLYSQIQNGAPFEMFLAADAKRPELLESEGMTKPGTRFTYAVGKLVLWSADPAQVDAAGEVLKEGGFAHLAIANPKTAPYGAAAAEVIASLGLTDALTPRLIQGDSITQTYQFVASGNAELGFVALAQVALLTGDKAGSRWMVPSDLYTPLAQQAVLLKSGEGKAAAEEFYAYLQSPEAKAVVEHYGYGLE